MTQEKTLRRYFVYSFLSGLQFGWTTWFALVVLRGGNPGWAESVYHLAIWLGEVPTGAVADILGRRVSMIVGLMIGAVAAFSHAWIDSTLTACIVLGISGLGSTFLSGADTALLYETAVDIGGTELARKALARASALRMGALSVAPIIAGALYEWNPIAPSTSRGVLSLLSAFIVWGMVERRQPLAQGEQRPSVWTQTTTAARIVAAQPTVLFIMLFTAIYDTVGSMVGQYGQAYFPYVGLSMVAAGAIFAAARLLNAGASSLSERLSAKGALRFLRAAPLAQSLAFVGMGLGGRWLGPAFFVFGEALDGAITPQLSHQLNEAIPSGQRATILSLQSAATSMMMVVAFPAASYLYPITSVYVITGTVGTLMAIVWMLRRWSY